MFHDVLREYVQLGMESTSLSTLERLLRQTPSLVTRIVKCEDGREIKMIDAAVYVCTRCVLLSQIDNKSIRSKANENMSLDVLELVLKCTIKIGAPRPIIESPIASIQAMIIKYYP